MAWRKGGGGGVSVAGVLVLPFIIGTVWWCSRRYVIVSVHVPSDRVVGVTTKNETNCEVVPAKLVCVEWSTLGGTVFFLSSRAKAHAN